MGNFIFFYEQNGEQKVMQLRLPIGTQIDFETWQGLFSGFKANLLRVAGFEVLIHENY